MNCSRHTSVSFGCSLAVLLTCGILATVAASAHVATSCETLKATQLPHTTITAADTVAQSAFTGASARGYDYKTLPAFCRVQGVIAPTSDSHIEFEVWMPASGWNGKYQGVGNGGFAGEITSSQLAAALSAGYATASTDTGHKGNGTDAQWALGHPEKIIDYGYRAIHETADRAKALVRAFYGEPAKYLYFTGCSNGGRQALMEAQRFPDDYDGIIAGAPAANFTHTAALFGFNLLATGDKSTFVPAAKFAAIDAAVVAACDAKDGVKDGVVTEPTTCAFDPAVLLCRDADSDSCLTSPQIATLKKLYSGVITANGQKIFPGFVPGGESGPGGWGLWLSAAAPDSSLEYAFATQFFKNMVHTISGLGLPHLQHRARTQSRGRSSWGGAQRHRSKSWCLSKTRRKVDSVSRLERRRSSADGDDRLPPRRRRQTRATANRLVRSNLYDAGRAALLRRPRSGYVRGAAGAPAGGARPSAEHERGDGAMGRTGNRTVGHHRHEIQRQDAS